MESNQNNQTNQKKLNKQNYNVIQGYPIFATDEEADSLFTVKYSKRKMTSNDVYFVAYINEVPHFALKKAALLWLGNAAGIKKVKINDDNGDEGQPLPTRCNKCIKANKGKGTVNCFDCPSQEVAARVTVVIKNPLTDEEIEYSETSQITKEEIEGQGKNKARFLKYRNEICETKALLRCVRALLNIQPSYTEEELKKPFLIPIYIPNTKNKDVKNIKLKNMEKSKDLIFPGKTKDSQKNIMEDNIKASNFNDIEDSDDQEDDDF